MGVHTIEPLPHKFPNPQQLHHSRDCPIWLAPGQTSPGDEVKNEDVKGGSFLEWHAWVLWTWKGQQKIQNVNPFERAWKNLPFGTSIQPPCLESTPPSWDQKSFSRSLKCVCQFAAMRIHGRGYRQGSGRVHKKKMQNTKKTIFPLFVCLGKLCAQERFEMICIHRVIYLILSCTCHDHHCHRFTGVCLGRPQPRSTSFEVKKNRPGTLDECLAWRPGGRLQP